jgi:hypothetical protein
MITVSEQKCLKFEHFRSPLVIMLAARLLTVVILAARLGDGLP